MLSLIIGWVFGWMESVIIVEIELEERISRCGTQVQTELSGIQSSPWVGADERVHHNMHTSISI